jgi:galactose mutarotase-like enzyme
MIFLENEHLTVSIAKKGAEIQKIQSKTTQLSYLWNGDATYWGKFSPILFPIVGALKGGYYLYNGQKYQLPRHGFARDHEFSVNQISQTEVAFKLEQSEETIKVYPFRFQLELIYQLSGHSLTCKYQVTNPDNQDLLFSIGGHPAFAAPMQGDIAYTDCYLQFNKDSTVNYHKIAGDLIANETETIKLSKQQLPLAHELFFDDALVFKSLKSDKISIRNSKNEHGLDFSFKDFPFFGIWAAKNANFVCLEPWCGIADGIDHNQELEDKEGIVKLAGHQQWTREWALTCY